MTAYPLSIFNDRPLPDNYRGPVFIWDIDKTYLSTRFSSVKGLAKIPVEFAIDKRAIPGMPEVLRGLRHGPEHDYAGHPLYFISASPPFLKDVIEHKMLLDGVEQDGITFKDWLGTLLQFRPGRLFEQLGFKLVALLTGRLSRLKAKEYLFGDDTEMDAEAFFLYSQLMNKKLNPDQFMKRVKQFGIPKDDQKNIQNLIKKIDPNHGKVEKIFIHLETNTPPEKYHDFGTILVPIKGGYQLALALYQLKLVSKETVQAAQTILQGLPKYHLGNTTELLKDAQKRRLILKKTVDHLRTSL